MSNNNTHTLGEAPWLHIIISTGFGTGFFPYGPGTAGAFVALLIWIGLYYLLSPMMLAIATALLIVGSLLIGVWTDNVMENTGVQTHVRWLLMSILAHGWLLQRHYLSMAHLGIQSA